MKVFRHLLPVSLLTMISFTFRPGFSPTEGLVAYYSFNECDARDDSGNGSHGRLFGDVGCWCGVEDDGLLFDGVDDFVEFHGQVNRYFNTTDFTISFYLKPEQYLLFRQSLLGKRPDCTEENMLDLLLDLGQGEIATHVVESESKRFSGLSPTIGEAGWMHFTLVREGIRAFTYVNGQLRQESFRCSGVDIDNEAVLSFANSPCLAEGARRFKGVVDELRIYDRALNQEEVKALYQLYPIENVLQDCVTQLRKKPASPVHRYFESGYLYGILPAFSDSEKNRRALLT